MKALLLKDLYMTAKYCKSFLLIGAVFLGVSLFASDNPFFIYYPCMYLAMLPVTLLSYDERSKWEGFSMTLPYTRGQLVSAKYLLGLLTNGIMLALIALAQAVKMQMDGGFQLERYGIILMSLVCTSFVSAAIIMPVIFRYGVEKGRLAYLLVLGFVCGGGILGAFLMEKLAVGGLTLGAGKYLAPLAAAVLYGLSWKLSIHFYRKREF